MTRNLPNVKKRQVCNAINYPCIHCNMSKTLMRITAQYEENYGWAEGGEHWKPKGGHEFELRADSDIFMYAEEQALAAIKTLLAKHSNKACRYTYVSHELVFHEPTPLSAEEFEKLVQELCNAQK